MLSAGPALGATGSGEKPWHQQLSDKALIEIVEKELGDLPEKFVPDLDDYPEKVADRVRSTPTRITGRRLVELEDRTLLLASLAGGGVPSSIATNCRIAVVLTAHQESKPVLVAHRSICSGGRTSRQLAAQGLRLSPSEPIFVVRMRQYPRTRTYRFYRLHEGNFDRILTFRTEGRPKNPDGADCSWPDFETRPAEDESATGHRLVATVECDPDAPSEAHKRVWRWTGSSYEEVTDASANYPPELGGSTPAKPDDE